MGTSVSNFQLLGVSEEAVRAALPHALVGTWSERFVTACPDPTKYRQLTRTAKALSARLECTLLLVDMFDGDTLLLALYQNGQRLTVHKAYPSQEFCSAGKPPLFCTGLGLPEELAPKLRRLFTDCGMQEEKLSILESLLGAPLFLRWDDEPPTAAVAADPGPLHQWLSEHPLPPKIKNQCRAELIQEIPDRAPAHLIHANFMIFRLPVYKDDDYEGSYTVTPVGDILGFATQGGERVHPLPDGRLELSPLPMPEPSDPDVLREALFPSYDAWLYDYEYDSLDGRLVITASMRGRHGSAALYCTTILHDSAGLLTPRILTLDGASAYACDGLYLLPDGGFLAVVGAETDDSRPPVITRQSALVCYGPDGTQQWAVWNVDRMSRVINGLIYAVDASSNPQRLLAVTMDGAVAAEYTFPVGCDPSACIVGNTPYLRQGQGWYEDDLLLRLTPDLRPDGQVQVPYMSDPVLSPDGALLYCAGFGSGLQVMDAATLRVLHRVDRRDEFAAPIVDRQNRLWVSNKSYLECYDPDLTLISRHRLSGEHYGYHWTSDGSLCVLTYQEKRALFRVYRFS